MRISALIDSTIAHIILFLPFALIATASLNPIPSTSLLALPNHSPSAPTAAPAIPNFDQHAHQLNKRHYYLCEGTTRTWQGEWYAASFYTANGAAASYDAAAATGAVQPPVEVLGQARECEAYRSAWEAYTRSLGPGGAGSGVITGGSTAGGQGGRATTGGGVVLTTQDGTPVFTQVQSTATVAGGITSGILTPSGQPSGPSVTGAVTSGPSGSSATKSASTGTSSSDDSQSLSSTSSSTPSSAAPTSSAGAGGTETGQNAGSPTSTNDDINTCAGKMDYQAWASVASAVWAILIGGIIWAIWAMLRGKVGDVYSPVKGASVDGPPPRFNILTLLSPFTLPSSAPILAIPAAALHLGAITGLVSLAGALPLYIANVPCLGTTSPRNALGGRLGTLTDLSLLRLLNALDPSPESPSRSESISAAANLASSRMSLLHSVHSGPARRALSDTIAPAISSAHVRLIIVLVLIGLITLLGGLWLVLREYRRMERKRRKMNEEAQWVDVVVLSKEEVPGWTGGEARLRERLVAAIKGTEDQDIGTRGEDAGQGEQDAAGQGEVDVQGVFAIPDTTALKKHVQERSALLVELERAEAADLAGKVFQPRLQLDTAHSDLPSPFADPARSQNRAPSPASSHITNPASLASLTSNNLLDRLRRSISPARSHTKPSAQRSGNASPDKSRFHEINRNSLALSGNGHGSGNGQSARFEIGQRIRIDEQGRYVPVTGSSEDAHGEEGPTPSDETTPSTASHLAGPSTSGQLGLVHEASTTRSAVPSALRPPSGITASSRSHIGSDPREGAGSTASTAHIVRPTPPHLIALRNRLRHANEAVIREQRAAMQRAIAGEGVVGWTVVGRGLRWLHRGKVLEGRTLQDARWSDLGKAVGAKTFVAKVAALAVVMSAMFIPVIGLTLASAPGFAYRLPFLRNLGRSNGLGSGIVQGLVPALIMTMLVVTGVWAIQRFASGLNTVSAVARDQLTYKATFWYLLTLCVVWALLVSSLEFAVQAFNLNIQEARFVADGAVFASWWVFILLVNLCIVVPGLYILQPIRLFRVWRAKRRGDFCRANAIELTPTYLLAPSLIGTFYILALSVLFPLLSIPCIILLYLSLVAVRYLSTFVCLPPTPTNAQYYNAELGMWTIRRIGWCLAIQPILFGLISLSRREWVIGAVSLGVAGAILVLIELTIGRKEHKRRTASGALSGEARGRLYRLEKTMTAGGVSTEETIQHRQEHMRQPSNSSLLLRISELLPGYSRLPPECPVPFENARLDDEYRTELAARTSPPPDSRPAVAVGSKRNESHQEGTGEKRVKVRTSESDGLFHDPTRANKGLVYPPELLLPGVVVWLPRVSGADRRAAELEEGYGLPTVLDGSEVDGGRGAA